VTFADLVHGSDSDTKDADFVAGVQTVGIGEVGDVGIPADAVPPWCGHHSYRDGKNDGKADRGRDPHRA